MAHDHTHTPYASHFDVLMCLVFVVHCVEVRSSWAERSVDAQHSHASEQLRIHIRTVWNSQPTFLSPFSSKQPIEKVRLASACPKKVLTPLNYFIESWRVLRFTFCSFFTRKLCAPLGTCIIHLKIASCVVFFSESKCERFFFLLFANKPWLEAIQAQFNLLAIYVWPSKRISTWDDSALTMTLAWIRKILFLTIQRNFQILWEISSNRERFEESFTVHCARRLRV